MIKRVVTFRWRVAVTAFAMAAIILVPGMDSWSQQPQTETVSGLLIDLTCAAKGRALMGKWTNAKSEHHMTMEGRKPNCAAMCLKGGQPAALFDAESETIKAVFACNPRATLADFAADEVEVQGFWAAGQEDGLNTFVPKKIRTSGSTSWVDVDCATMHN